LSAVAAPPKREFYEIKIYHLKSADQEARVENFLKDAYVPAAHRAGIKNVGVFKPVATDTAGRKADLCAHAIQIARSASHIAENFG
jgi:hypothetical protein